MQSKLTTISKTEKEIEVSLPPEEFLPYVDYAANKLSKDLEVQGFRKGHIPRDIVEQKVGTSGLYNEASELAVQATYEKALKNSEKDGKQSLESNESGDSSMRSMGYIVPEVQITKLAPNNPFIYKIILRAPVFELAKDYKSIAEQILKNNSKEIRVEEKEVDDTIKWLAKQKLQQSNNKDNKEDQAPKKEAELLEPPLDDDFAKSFGNFKNLEELKKSVREGIHLEKEKKEKDRVRLAITNAIISKSHAEIPEKVIDQEILKIEEEFKQNIAQMGLDFDEYLKKIKKTKEELRNGWRDQAKDRISTFLVLDAIASIEDIEPEEKEVEEEAQKILNHFKNADEAKKDVDPARLRAYVYGIIRNEKVFQLFEI